MLLLLWASVLAAGVLSLSEYLYILLTCGPFWMGPGQFLLSWLLYCIPVIIGMIVLHLIVSAIPPLKKIASRPVGKFKFYFNLAWIISVLFLIAFVIKDLDLWEDSWVLIVIAFLEGGVAMFLLARLLRRGGTILASGIWILVLLLVVGNGVYLFSDLSYAGKVKSRSTGFTGIVPHISLIVLDTMRGDHFSCYGYPFNTTPNMDRIAREGLRCDNAFSASHWTPPGHISIFTGKLPSQHANEGQPYTPDDLVTITEILRGEGYFCAALYNNPLAGRNINLTQGFDVDLGVYRHSWVLPAWMRLRDKLIYHDSGSKATFPIAAEIAQWVSKKGGHLFLYLNLVEPHADYIIHEPYFSEFTRDLDFNAIPNLQEVKALCNYLEKVVYDSVRFSGYNADSYRYLRAAYDSEVAYLDHQFGVYHKKMAQSGLLDKTLLVITADHGEFLGEHFTRGHPGILYDPVIRIPLIFRYPDLIKPNAEERYVSNVDILPTVLTLAGYAHRIPDDVQGISLLDQYPLKDRAILSERVYIGGGCYTLMRGDYKVILNTGTKFLQKFPFDTLMYNIKDDPGETQNIFPSTRKLGLEMLTELTEWVSRIEVHPTEKIRLNHATKANLRALGYVN